MKINCTNQQRLRKHILQSKCIYHELSCCLSCSEHKRGTLDLILTSLCHKAICCRKVPKLRQMKTCAAHQVEISRGENRFTIAAPVWDAVRRNLEGDKCRKKAGRQQVCSWCYRMWRLWTGSRFNFVINKDWSASLTYSLLRIRLSCIRYRSWDY